MYSAKVTVDTDVLDELREIAKRSPRAVDAFVNGTVKNDLRARLKETLGVKPGPPRYPLRWKSAKQRRAFFATNGFGKGIPYERKSPGIEENWEIEIIAKDGEGLVSVVNDAPAAQYVYGPRQQPFHADTGWPDADYEVLKMGERANDLLIDGWYSISDPGKGVRLA